jgi:hypothetical protein
MPMTFFGIATAVNHWPRKMCAVTWMAHT